MINWPFILQKFVIYTLFDLEQRMNTVINLFCLSHDPRRSHTLSSKPIYFLKSPGDNLFGVADHFVTQLRSNATR